MQCFECLLFHRNVFFLFKFIVIDKTLDVNEIKIKAFKIGNENDEKQNERKHIEHVFLIRQLHLKSQVIVKIEAKNKIKREI